MYLPAVTSVPSSAFRGSTIPSLEFGDALETIGDKAFRGSKIQNLTIGGASLVSIADAAFSSPCTSLKRLVIHNTSALTSIGSDAFYGCPLELPLYLPAVTSVPSSAFRGSTIPSYYSTILICMLLSLMAFFAVSSRSMMKA